MLDAWRCLLAVGLLSDMGHAEDCPALALVQSRAEQMKQWRAAMLSKGGAGVPNSLPNYECPQYDGQQSMGGFEVTDNMVKFNGKFASVLYDLGQRSGKLYLEYTRTGASPWASYVGVQRTPTKHGVYHDGGSANGNGGDFVRFAVAGDGVSANGVNSLLIDMDAGTASINGMAPQSIPGQGQMFFGVYDGTSSDSGTVTLNFGQESFSKDMPEGASAWCRTPPDASEQVLADFVTLDFRYASLVQNNLGGKGPDIGGPEVMEFKNVSKYGGRSLNLEIRSLSDYYPADVNKNYLDGAFGQINVLNEKSVDLALTLRYDDSGEAAQVPKFNVSFWDLDTGKKYGGVESVTVGPILAHFTTSQSELITTKISQSKWKFTATEFGKMDDNPHNLTVLTQDQLNRALEVETWSPTLYVTLNVSMWMNNWQPERGRTFLIGGSYNNPAFSERTLGEPAPTPAPTPRPTPRPTPQPTPSFAMVDGSWSSWSAWDQPSEKDCGGGVLKAIQSYHHNYFEDRRWSYQCAWLSGGGVSTTQGAWSEWSQWDSRFETSCRSNEVLSALKSEHHNYREDRRFKYKCSRVNGATLTLTNGWVAPKNAWDGPWNPSCSGALQTILSDHHNYFEDRQWLYKCATITA